MPFTGGFYIHRKYTIRTGGALPTSLTPCEEIIDSSDCNTLVLYVDFTKGSLTDGTLEVEASYDKLLWYGVSTYDTAAGGLWTARRLLYKFSLSLRHRIVLNPIMDRWLRIRVAGTGDPADSNMVVYGYIGTT